MSMYLGLAVAGSKCEKKNVIWNCWQWFFC